MSPLSIGEITSEIVPEAEPATVEASPSSADPWERAERLRSLQRQLEADAQRTRAEGYGA